MNRFDLQKTKINQLNVTFTVQFIYLVFFQLKQEEKNLHVFKSKRQAGSRCVLNSHCVSLPVPSNGFANLKQKLFRPSNESFSGHFFVEHISIVCKAQLIIQSIYIIFFVAEILCCDRFCSFATYLLTCRLNWTHRWTTCSQVKFIDTLFVSCFMCECTIARVCECVCACACVCVHMCIGKEQKRRENK